MIVYCIVVIMIFVWLFTAWRIKTDAQDHSVTITTFDALAWPLFVTEAYRSGASLAFIMRSYYKRK